MLITPPIGFANDFTFIDYFKDKTRPQMSECIGVVIPHYNRTEELKLNLQALSRQTYPSKNLEVVIADDGSSFDFSTLIQEYSAFFKSLILVRQDDKGFRLSRIRNLGIQALQYSEKVVVLDCDIIPCPTLIEKHFQVLSVSDRVVSIGFRQDSFAVKEVADVLEEPTIDSLDWRIKHLNKGEYYLKTTNDVWRLCSGGNLAFYKKTHSLEPFDESFEFWGGEDNEWAYRLHKKGFYFYPNTDARAYHARLTDVSYNKVLHKELSIAHTRKKCPSFDEFAYNLSDWQSPLISFWITNYNCASYIKTAIESLRGCRFSNEIIVVDNNSSDNSLEVLANIPNIRVVHEKNQGAFFAFERALLEVKGEFAIQLDADDALDINFINEYVERLLHSPIGLLYALIQPCDKELLPIADYPIWNPSSKTRAENILSGMHIRCPRILRMRDLARAPKRNFLSSAADFNLYSKVLFTTHSTCVEDVAYFYRNNPNSITNTNLDSQKENTLSVIHENRALLVNGNLLTESARLDRSVQYVDNNPQCYYIDHLNLTENALRAFSDKPNPLGLISDTLMDFRPEV